MRYGMSVGVELLSSPLHRAFFRQSCTSNGTWALHVISCRQEEPEETLQWRNSQLTHLLMPHRHHLFKDQIMHPTRVVEVGEVEDVEEAIPVVAPIGEMLALMRTPMRTMMILIVWNRPSFLCQVTTTLLSQTPAINFIVLDMRSMLLLALNLYLAPALLISS